jgi:hypothetical protein
MVHSAVALLRRVLYLYALFGAVIGVVLVTFPRFLLVDLLGQPGYPDYAWVRLVGTHTLGLALLGVLVGQRVEDLWWWCWAFVAMAFGTAAVTTLHAAFGVPSGADLWPWLVLAGWSWVIAFGLVWGIARAGVERPPP